MFQKLNFFYFPKNFYQQLATNTLYNNNSILYNNFTIFFYPLLYSSSYISILLRKFLFFLNTFFKHLFDRETLNNKVSDSDNLEKDISAIDKSSFYTYFFFWRLNFFKKMSNSITYLNTEYNNNFLFHKIFIKFSKKRTKKIALLKSAFIFSQFKRVYRQAVHQEKIWIHYFFQLKNKFIIGNHKIGGDALFLILFSCFNVFSKISFRHVQQGIFFKYLMFMNILESKYFFFRYYLKNLDLLSKRLREQFFFQII